MTADWPRVPLGAVAKPVDRWEPPTPGTVYRQVGVRLWGEGAYERESIDGGETKYRTLSRIESGDIIVNKIWARNGSVAVVSDSLAGCFGSGEFPTFAPDRSRLDPRWMHWLTKTADFWHQCDVLSRGTSGKNRIKPELFLTLEIPLPPLAEQRRIVARVEGVAARIAEARQLREETSRDTDALTRAESRAAFEAVANGSTVQLESVCMAIIDNLHSNPVYAETGVPTLRSPDVGWGKLFLETALKTSEEEYRRRTVRGEPSPDDIVLVREGGGTGKAALVEPGQRFSLGQRVMMLRPDKSKVLPKFVLYQLLSPVIYDDQILPLSTGSASPHLNIGALRKFPFHLPPLPEQRRIVAHLDALQAKADAVRALQSETAAELDALLPAVLAKAFAGEL